MNDAQAEAVGLDALLWLAGDEARMGAFLAASGADPGDLRRLGADPIFLAAVIDHILGEDVQVLAFAAAAGLAPETILRARAALPGGAIPDWT